MLEAKKPEISVIVCTYNRAPSLRELLASLKDIDDTGLTWELIVVDNNSTDDTKNIVRDFQAKFDQPMTYVFEPRQGKSYALNTGIRTASGRWLLFTDDDATVHEQWVREVKRIFVEYSCIGVGGRIIPVWDTQMPRWFSREGEYRLMAAIVAYEPADTPAVIVDEPPFAPPFGANVAFDARAFEKYGLYRVDLGPTGRNYMLGEDTEFCRRIMAAGEKIVYAPDAIVYHPVEKERLNKSYFQRFYYNYGKLQVQLGKTPRNAVRYLGVPRYLVRDLFNNFVQYFVSFDPRRRFFYKLRYYEVMGRIAQSWNFRNTVPVDRSVDK